VVYTTDGGRGFPHLRVSAGAIPVSNAIDVWRMCLRVTFLPPPPKNEHPSVTGCVDTAVQHTGSAGWPTAVV
jgi:hypothetical protein